MYPENLPPRIHDQQGETIMQSRISSQIEPALAFHLMKFAFQVFEKETIELTAEEYAEAYQQAYHEITLHEQILRSDAACGVVIPERTLQAAIDVLQAEHGGERVFFHHLHINNLHFPEFLVALQNDLKVEAILARVAFCAEPVSPQELLDYYHAHQDSFCVTEQRSTRHILISTENSYSHLPQDSSRQRAGRIHARLQNDPQGFRHEARLYSDCTTASDGGDLGMISRGELCPALDQALFQLAAGEISPIIQTSKGFHILLCEAIHPGQRLNFREASHHIHQILTRKNRIDTCKTWLKSLFYNLK
jgi:peptidyl-prolyl cis-trans isomerase C